MGKILNKCPLCGSSLEFSHLMQYANVFKVLKNGELSKNRIRREGSGSMECGFLNCVNSDCDFRTDSDLNVVENRNIEVYQENGKYMYEVKE